MSAIPSSCALLPTRSLGSGTTSSRANPRSFDTSFERRCYEDERPAARGTWRFRAGDDVPLPAWMVPGPRPQIDAPPDPLRGSTAVPEATAVPRGCRQAAGTRVRLGTKRADRLRGTRRADLIRSRAGNDRIYARAGADCVLGGRGADLLVGGPGRDLLDCGQDAGTVSWPAAATACATASAAFDGATELTGAGRISPRRPSRPDKGGCTPM